MKTHLQNPFDRVCIAVVTLAFAYFIGRTLVTVIYGI